jgi:hypothetical protein
MREARVHGVTMEEARNLVRIFWVKESGATPESVESGNSGRETVSVLALLPISSTATMRMLQYITALLRRTINRIAAGG